MYFRAGTSGHVERPKDLVINSYIERSPDPVFENYAKYFVKPSAIYNLAIHYVKRNGVYKQDGK